MKSNTDYTQLNSPKANIIRGNYANISLKTCNFNASGFNTKFRYLKDFLNDNDPGVVALIETCLDGHTDDRIFCPLSYK